MEYSKINSLLNDITYPKSNKNLKFINTENGHQGVPDDSYGSQGEYNESFEIYQVISDPEVFIKFTYRTDSYGQNRYLHGIKFVKGKKKTIEIYEPIK